MSPVLELVRDRLPVWLKNGSSPRQSRRRTGTRQLATQHRLRLTVPQVSELRVRDILLACDLLSEGFENIEILLESYVREFSDRKCSTSEEDIESFLQWLAVQDGISEEQKDVIICQRARLSVDYVVLARHLAHIRFQELLKSQQSSASVPEKSRDTLIHLNPIRVLATLETHALVDADEALPALVLFYPVQSEVRSLVVDGTVNQLLQRLSSGALSLRRLAQLTEIHWDDLVNLVEDLAAAGVVARS